MKDILIKQIKERRTFSCGCERVKAHRRAMNSSFERKTKNGN